MYDSNNRLKVMGVLNHLGHQYDLLKITKKYPVKFYWLENNVRRWSNYAQRPEPTTWLNKDEFEWVQYYEPGKYDMAVLHVDQQHVNPNIGKGFLYKQMNEVIQDIPKMVINHGTPMYAEMYDEDTVINGGVFHKEDGTKINVKGMKELIGDNFMVVNSYSAVDRWGWGYPLIHGMTASEWWDLPKEPRITMSLSPGGLDKYYNRQLISQIKGYVKEMTGYEIYHIGVNFKPTTWDEYRTFMGSSLIQIYPFKDSPMPRSRTEAMLSGCCVLTSRYHGAEEFIKHGVDGFIMPDNPKSYADTIGQLLSNHYKESIDIGQKAKTKATHLFDIDRYHDDLWYILQEVAKGNKPMWDRSKIWSVKANDRKEVKV